MSLTDKQIDEEFKKGNVVPYWDKKIHEELVGFEIVGARYMKDVECPENWAKAPMLLLRKPGSAVTYHIIAQMDDEGNDAGAFGFGCFDPKIDEKIYEEQRHIFPII
tara:strand:- start:2009 stop:2329 length:321 start_codon:yes stop_codon:yes gene_type:complete